ncbi:hypothetical protein CsatB_025807 [Cannabis sativa]
MGNCQASRSADNEAHIPAAYNKYSTSQPNMGYGYNTSTAKQAPTTPPRNHRKPAVFPAVMDCNEAAQRYGGVVISEYGGKRKLGV